VEASDNELILELDTGVLQVAIEECTDHQAAIDGHLEHARRVAYESGRQQAAKEAEIQMRQTELQQQEHVEHVLAALTDAVPQMLKEAESAIKDLAVSVAQKFVETCPITEERIHHLITDALKGIHGTSKIIITLHPDDLNLIDQAKLKLGAECQSSGEISFKPSTILTRGGCRIETDFGQLDATIESKSNQIKHLLAGPGIAA
jgi:flagellar assembly protein FliH